MTDALPEGLGGVVRADLIQADEGDQVVAALAGRLRRFVFIDRDKKKDVAEFHLENRDQRLIDDPAVRKGQKWLVTWGWPNLLATPRRMIVHNIKGNNPLVVVLHDESTLLDKAPKHRVWHNVADSDVVLEVARDNGYEGLLADVEPTVAVRRNVTQATTDARLLQRLARRNGCVWYVDAAGLHFHPRRYGVEPTHGFSYPGGPGGERVLSDPQISGRLNNVALVRVKARDPWAKEDVEAEMGVATDDDTTLGDYITQIISLGAEEELGDPDAPDGARQARVSQVVEVNLGAATQEEVNTAAVQLYTETIRNKYKMEVRVLGDPTAGAKQVHYWRMASEAFSGLYYCREAKTVIEPGRYDMEMRYVKDALGKIAASKVLRVGKKKNPKKTPTGTEYTQKILSIGGSENGKYVEKWIFVDAEGKTVGEAEELSDDEKAGLSAAQQQYINNAAGAQSLPGD